MKAANGAQWANKREDNVMNRREFLATSAAMVAATAIPISAATPMGEVVTGVLIEKDRVLSINGSSTKMLVQISGLAVKGVAITEVLQIGDVLKNNFTSLDSVRILNPTHEVQRVDVMAGNKTVNLTFIEPHTTSIWAMFSVELV